MAERFSFESLLVDVCRRVDPALEEIWNEAGQEYTRYGEAVVQPLAAARALCLRGGKRLRAGLVAVGHCLGSGVLDLDAVLPMCCAVELLQAYFLIHDDWMDQDRLRRGGPAVHAALESVFGSQHLAACGAVLAGDYTLALATRVLARSPPPAALAPLLKRFAQMQLDAVLGQQLDVLGDGSNLDDVYRLKTASYTVFGPLALGLELSGRGEAGGDALAAFASPLGVAFQLRDDLIGAFGATAVTGKPRGSDVLAGKRTPLISAALRLGTPDAIRAIRAALGNPGASGAALDAALTALEGSGAPEHVAARIEELVAQARQALLAGGFDARGRALLEGVLRSLTAREH